MANESDSERWFPTEDAELAAMPPLERAVAALFIQERHRGRLGQLAQIRAEAMAEALAGGETVASLAEKLKVSRSAIYRALSEANIEATRTYRTGAVTAGAIAAGAAGAAAAGAIAPVAGLAAGYVARRASRK